MTWYIRIMVERNEILMIPTPTYFAVGVLGLPDTDKCFNEQMTAYLGEKFIVIEFFKSPN